MLGRTARERKGYEVAKNQMVRELLIHPTVPQVTVQDITDAYNSGEEVRKSSSFCSARNENADPALETRRLGVEVCGIRRGFSAPVGRRTSPGAVRSHQLQKATPK